MLRVRKKVVQPVPLKSINFSRAKIRKLPLDQKYIINIKTLWHKKSICWEISLTSWASLKSFYHKSNTEEFTGSAKDFGNVEQTSSETEDKLPEPLTS